jgi:hypothetical protein
MIRAIKPIPVGMTLIIAFKTIQDVYASKFGLKSGRCKNKAAIILPTAQPILLDMMEAENTSPVALLPVFHSNSRPYRHTNPQSAEIGPPASEPMICKTKIASRFPV